MSLWDFIIGFNLGFLVARMAYSKLWRGHL